MEMSVRNDTWIALAPRKYLKTAAMSAASYVGDHPLFLADYLLRLMRVLVLLALWRTLLAGRGAVSSLTLDAVLTYTLASEAFAQLLAPRTPLNDALWNGTICNRLLRPLGLFGDLTAESAGRWVFNLLVFSLPLFLLAPLLGVRPWPASPLAGALFLLSLGLAVAVGLAIEFIFGVLMVALELPRWAVEDMRSAATALLTGAVIPLALLPWGIGVVFDWLPFAAMASAPLQIYVGAGNAASLLAMQAGWALVLWPLAMILWRWNREKLVGYGG
jgi:ABC-2 type transport system permease protein